MRSFILLIVLSLTIIPAFSTEYVCKWNTNNGAGMVFGITTEDLTKTSSEKCSLLKQYSENQYQYCMNQNNEYKRLYNQGLCQEVGTKKYNIDGSDCTIKYILKTGEDAGYYNCSGKI